MVSSTFTWSRLAAALAIAAASALPALAKYNNGFDPDAREVARLPKFCQGQYVPSLRNAPGYTITGCGVYANHFCPALVLLNRAEDVTVPRQERQYALKQAGDNLAYSRNHLPSTCWLMPNLSASEARFKLLTIMLK
jgi:hypothetical protein